MGNNPGAYLTAEDVLENRDLSKKVVVVTGSNSGIGKEAARVFAKAGAVVIIAARDTKKCEEVKQEFLKELKDVDEKKIIILPLDLGDFSSIDSFVESFQKLGLQLHILVCNAGVMMTPYKKTKDGFEFQQGVNHLGHARLIFKLLPVMSESDGQKRVVILSSRGHLRGKKMIDFEDYHFEKRKYDPLDSYAQSKLSALLFASELNRRLARDFGSENFLCCSVHPGVIQTGLQGELSPAKKFLIMTAMRVTQGIKTVEQGAATTMYGSVSDKIKGGEYLADCGVAKEILDYALDKTNQKKLFELTEKEVKINYKDCVKTKEDNKVEETKNVESKKETQEVVEQVEKPKRVGLKIRAESITKENHEEFYRAIGFPEKYLKGFVQTPVIFETVGDKEGYDFALISPLAYETSGKWGEEVQLEPLCMSMNVVWDFQNNTCRVGFTLENGKKYHIDRIINDKEGIYQDEFHYGDIVAKTTYKRIKL